MTKQCQVCGVTFVKPDRMSRPQFEKRKYCSIICSIKNTGLQTREPYFKGKKNPAITGDNHPRWKEKIERACKFCKKSMLLSPWESSKQFCSIKCDKDSRKEQRIIRDTKPCESCGMTFEGKRKGSRFCSKECQGYYLAKKFKGRPCFRPKNSYTSGELNPSWKQKIERTCKVCGTTFLVKPSDVVPSVNEKNPASFCSRKCYGLSHRGSDSPVWKGGKLSDTQFLREKIHMMPEHKVWHATILKRDGYKCVSCSSGSNLEVHHKKSISDTIRENNLKTTEEARNCKELWDVSAGETLCKSCHKKTDSWGRHRKLGN
jgi:hypothetical protein